MSMETIGHVVAIDPSIRSLGLACSTICHPRPVFCSGIEQRTDTDESWQGRALGMAMIAMSVLIEQLNQHDIDEVIAVVECPNNWFTGRGISSKDNEAVQKLYFFVGALLQQLSILSSVKHCFTVTPGDWKGQVGKSVMLSRAAHYYSTYDLNWPASITDDAAEAILLARVGAEYLEKGIGSPRSWRSVGAMDMYVAGKSEFDIKQYL